MNRRWTMCAVLLTAAVFAFGGLAFAETEILKGGMAATASGNYPGWDIFKAIDNLNDESHGWYAALGTDAWLRLDLGARYKVTRFGYQPRVGYSDGRINGYELYVSDTYGPAGGSGGVNAAAAQGYWGAPVVTGTWPDLPTRVTDVTMAGKDGRYLILRASSAYGSAGANEVWVFGSQPDSRITAFSVSDQATGNAYWTTSATINVTFTAEAGAGAIDGYMINEDPSEPSAVDPNWIAPPLPATYAIVGAQGSISLYAWVRDESGFVAGATDIICLSNNVLAIENVLTALNGYVVTASWTTTADAVGWVAWGIQGQALSNLSAPTAYGTMHSVDVTLPMDGTTYTLEIHSNATTTSADVVVPLATPTATGNVVWTNASGSKKWSQGANWLGKQQPALTSTGTVSFNNVGSVADATTTSILDPQVLDPEATSWTIGGFSIGNPPTGTLTSINHNIDLGGNTLAVNGATNIAVHIYDGSILDRKTATALFTNGTLQLGTPTTARDLTIGTGSDYYVVGILNVGTGATLSAYLNNVDLGGWNGGMGILDLRNGQIAGGTFRAANLVLSSGGGANNRTTYSEILASATSNLQNFEITGSLRISDGGASNFGRIGSTTSPLPANVNITVGVPATARGNLIIGRQSCWSGDGALVASTGGTFTAYVTDLIVGKNAGGLYARSDMAGLLDIRSMSACVIDATNFQVGVARDAANSCAYGRAYLGSGTVTTGTLLVGDGLTQTGNHSGLLQLDGTQFAVAASATVKKTGSIVTHVKGKSAGLDLAADATLSIADGASVQIAFDNAQDAGESGEYWGMRWETDKRAVISGLHSAGKLIWTVAEGVLGSANIYYDGAYTYVSLKAEWPPIVITKSLTVEVRPPDFTTIVIDIQDIDASPPDPEITDRTITCPQDTDIDPNTVTLLDQTALATYSITLTLTKGEESAFEVATLTVAPVADGIDAALIWTGEASLTQMERRQWFWGNNWQGGVPPAVDALPALTFADQGIGLNVVAEDRDAGSLTYTNTTGTYTTYLSTKALSVHDAITVGDTGRVSKVEFLNGTVNIGIPDDPCNVFINSDGTGWSTMSFANVTVGLELGTVVIGDASSGARPSSQGALDLTGATIAGGLLKANSISLGTGADNLTSPQGNILVSSTSGLSMIQVAGTLGIATGHRAGVCRFGDPGNGYNLPEGVSIRIGADESSRGDLLVGRVNYDGQNANGLLQATAGGTVTAWLNSLLVGWPGVGTVDFSKMDSCAIDANTVGVGLGLRIPSWSTADGKLKLPPGTLYAETLEIGTVQDSPTAGLLELNGTMCTIGTSLLVNTKGVVQTNVGAAACGLDIPEAATFTIAAGGKVNIAFTQEPGETEKLWGLRWQGDHTATLLGMKNDGKLAWDTSAITQAANISYDGETGYTYVGIVPPQSNYPPIARVKNVAEVLDSAMGQTFVVVTVDEVNDASFDPDGPEDIVDITIACTADTDGDAYTVTLAAAGDYTVTLTITDSMGQTGTADATVSVTEPQAEGGNLTWTGAALGREWTWGANWVGGNYPANPTGGILFFLSPGAGTNLMNAAGASWTIGGLSVKNSDTGTAADITHTFDLNGKKLFIYGSFNVANYGQYHLGDRKTTNAIFTNGALQIGTAAVPQDVMISNPYNYPGVGVATMDVGTTFQAYLKNVTIGASNWGVGKLDLANTQIVGGTFKAANLTMGIDGEGGAVRTWNEIAFGEASGLQNFQVTGNLTMADGNSGNYARIGNPDTGWTLPAGVNIKLGTDAANRSNVVIGRTSWWAGEGRLAASSGGTFQGWLGDLIVGKKTYTSIATVVGTLDARYMDSCTLDINNVEIGVGVETSGANAKGYVYLPKGTATAGTVTLGDAASGSVGTLGLEGTQFAVNTSLTIKRTGFVAIHTLGTSSGLDLADAAALTVAEGGKINITFDAPAGSGAYYGLRWAGDHAADLQALVDAGQLTWDETALPQPASIFVQGGYTCVGVSVEIARLIVFTVADRTTASSLVTNEDAVSVNIVGEAAEGQTIAGWAIVEAAGEPSSWSSTAPTSYTILAAPGGSVTLYAWVKDTAGNTAGKSATIYYSTAAPVVTNIVITAGTGTATVTWNTDIMTEGAVKFGPVSLAGSTPNVVPENGLLNAHSVAVSGLAAGINYKWVVVNNGVEAAPVWWPSMWPVACDVNRDCKVNILDLISIRNKLNQPVSGENIFADVNLPAPDGKINILDLIAVRNKLNTQCPQ